MPQLISFRKAAFTLAEVLITLGIIGVVAAMTMPTLIANHKDKETVVKLKKVHSVFSQAMIRAIDEHGTPDNWNLNAVSDPDGAANMMNIFNKYLSNAKICVAGEKGCWYNGSELGYRTYSVLSDGTNVYYQTINQNCNANRGYSSELQKVCGAIGVDVNGAKPPNKIGYDIFQFYVTKETIVPYGSQDETVYTFNSNCSVSGNSNYGCTAWVILNENRDYLKCKSLLNWNGKNSCK